MKSRSFGRVAMSSVALWFAITGACASHGDEPPADRTASAGIKTRSAADVLGDVRRFPVFAPRLESAASATHQGWVPAVPDLDVTLPDDASAALRVGLVGDARSWIELTPEGGAPRHAESAGPVRVFADAALDLDVIHVADRTRAEEIRLLRSPSAKATTRYRVRLGEGLSHLRVVGDRIEAVDAAGVVRLATEPLFAVDAKGVRTAMSAHVDRDELVVTLATEGLSYPIAVDPSWVAVGGLTAKHTAGQMIALADKRVLVFGGLDPSTIATTELYDPTAKTWAVVDPMNTPRYRHGGVLLGDGRVLAFGGNSGDVSAETFDPSTLAWTNVTGSMKVGRFWRDSAMPAVLLPSGKVFIAGGFDSATATPELFDPATSTFALVAAPPASLGTSIDVWVALMSDGKVAVANGSHLALYNPSTNTWGSVFTLATGVVSPAPALYALSGARVLMAQNNTHTETAIFTEATSSFSAPVTIPTGSSGMYTGAYDFQLLPTAGKLFGYDGGNVSVYDIATDSWSPSAAGYYVMSLHTAATTGGILGCGGPGTGLNCYLYVALANGTACASNGVCESGHCVDGVCCNAACSTSCQACDVAGKVGTCTIVSGAPHGTRTPCTGTGTCGGSCTGSTICSYPTGATACGTASCTSGTATAVGACNGSGSCTPGATTSCPAGCAGTICATPVDAGPDTGMPETGAPDAAMADATAADTTVTDTADTAVTDTADTAVTDTADTAADTAIVDTADTAVTDTADTAIVDTADTAMTDTADTAMTDTTDDTSVEDAVVDTTPGEGSDTSPPGERAVGSECDAGMVWNALGECVVGKASPDGGCACGVPGQRPDRTRAALGLSLGLASFVFARRRKRRERVDG